LLPDKYYVLILQAYHSDDKNNYRLVAVIIDAYTFLAVLLIIAVVSTTVTWLYNIGIQFPHDFVFALYYVHINYS